MAWGVILLAALRLLQPFQGDSCFRGFAALSAVEGAVILLPTLLYVPAYLSVAVLCWAVKLLLSWLQMLCSVLQPAQDGSQPPSIKPHVELVAGRKPNTAT